MAMTRDYLDYLDDQATITPADSQEEYLAAQTILGMMAEHGVDCTMEEFDAPASGRRAYQILFVMEFLGVVLAGVDNGWVRFGGIALVVVAFVLLALERSGRHVFTGFGRVGRSQNVVAYHRASGPLVEKGSRPIVIVAHYDSGRENPLYTTSLARYLVPMRRNSPVLVLVGAACALVQCLVFLPAPARLVVWAVGIVAALPLLVLGAGELVASSAPFTPGVNDNKSSVAAMLGVLEDVYPTGTTHELSGRRALEEQEEQLDADESAVADAIGQDEADEGDALHDGVSGEDGAPRASAAAPGEDAEDEEGGVPAAEEDAPGEPAGIDAAVVTSAPGARAASRRVLLPWESEPLDDGAGAVADGGVPAAEAPAEGDAPAAAYEPEDDGTESTSGDGTLRQDAAPAAGAAPADRLQPATPAANVPSFMVGAPAAEVAPGDTDGGLDAERDGDGSVPATEAPAEGDALAAEHESADGAGDHQEPPVAEDVTAEPAVDGQATDEVAGVRPAGDGADTQVGVADDAGDSQGETGEAADEAAGVSPADANDPFSLPGYEWPPIAEYEPVGAPSERARLSVDEERVIPFGDDATPADEADSTTNLETPPDASDTASLQAEAEDGREASAKDDTDTAPVDAEAEDAEPAEAEPAPGDGHEPADSGSGSEGACDAAPSDAAGQTGTTAPAVVRHGAEVIEQLGILPPSCEIDYVRDAEPDAGETDAREGDESVRADGAPARARRDPHAESVENGAGTARDYLNLFLDPLEIEVVEPDEVKASTEYVADDDVVTPVEEKEAGEVGHQEVFTPRLDEADDTAPSGPVEFGMRPQHVDADATLASRPEDEVSDKGAHGNVIQFAAARRIHLPRLDDDAASEAAPAKGDAKAGGDSHDDGASNAASADDPDATVAATGEVLSELVREGRMGLDVNQEERDASLPDQDSAGLYNLGAELGDGKPRATDAAAAPTPVDDPTWGQSTYTPSASSIARRASLLDLPDPAQDEVDPLADADGTRVQPRRHYNRRKGGSGGDLDGFGGSDEGHWKGGATPRADLRLVADEGNSGDGEGTPDRVPDEAELRESVTSMGTDDLLCHDIWFVALGASDFDHAGMKAFLDAHRSDIRGAFLVNLDCVGAGDLTLLATEGLLGTRHADRRLVRMLRSIASDFHVELGLEDHDWEDTDATPAMRRSVRAVSIVGLDEFGLPAYEGSPYDELDVVDADQVALVNDMVTELIRRS